MTGELSPPDGTSRPVWTVSALQIYTEQLIAALRDRLNTYEQRHTDTHERLHERVDTQMAGLIDQVRREGGIRKDALDSALATSEAAAEKRFDAFAQFRDDINRTAATLINRQELSAALGLINEKITAMLSRLDKIEGKSSGMSTLMASLLAGAGAAAALISVVVLLARRG
jgi:uncharacterized phage infection (PIP) family protein YhgE